MPLSPPRIYWAPVTEEQVAATQAVVAHKITSGPDLSTPPELEPHVTLAMSFLGALTNAIHDAKQKEGR